MSKHPVIIEDTGLGLFQVDVRAQGTSFFSDEPISSGGLASGPGPFDLLSAALGACTVMTVKFYAQRKSIAVSHVQVMITHQRDPESQRDVFERSIFIDANGNRGRDETTARRGGSLPGEPDVECRVGHRHDPQSDGDRHRLGAPRTRPTSAPWIGPATN